MPFLDFLKTFKEHPEDIIKNLSLRFPRHKSQEKYVFVVGAPRSGTTLVKTLLCAHPQLAGAEYESTTLFNFTNILRKQNFFESEGLDSKRIDEIMSQSKDIIEIFDLVATEYLSKSNATMFVEKLNSMNLNRLKFVQIYFPYSKIIHIVRDGRDCYCSARHHPYVFQGNSLNRYAKYWKKCINSRLNINNDNVIDIKYENLINDPKKQLADLMNFINLSFDPMQIDPQKYGDTKLKKQKSHKRLAQAISKSSQGRWKEELTEKEVKKFEKIAGKELKKIGYQVLNQ